MTVLLEKGSHGQLQSQHLPEELKENHKNNSPVVRFGFLKAVLGSNTMPTSKQFVIFQSYYTPLTSAIAWQSQQPSIPADLTDKLGTLPMVVTSSIFYSSCIQLHIIFSTFTSGLPLPVNCTLNNTIATNINV